VIHKNRFILLSSKPEIYETLTKIALTVSSIKLPDDPLCEMSRLPTARVKEKI